MKIRNVSKFDRYVGHPINRMVAADEIINVPDADAPGLLCQPLTWAAESIKKTEA